MTTTLTNFAFANRARAVADRARAPIYDARNRPAIVFELELTIASCNYDAPEQHVTATAGVGSSNVFYLAVSGQIPTESSRETDDRIAANPINRGDPTGKDFIALGDNPVYEFANNAAEQLATLGWSHYNLTYWKGRCTSTGGQVKASNFQSSHPLMGSGYSGVELVPYFNVDVSFKGIPGSGWMGEPPAEDDDTRFDSKTGNMSVSRTISVIHYFASPVWIKSIYTGTPAEVKAKWDTVLREAATYPFAEQLSGGAAIAKPYRYPFSQWEPFGNNSNSFIRWLMVYSGLGRQSLSGLHGGNDLPAREEADEDWNAQNLVVGETLQ